MKQLTIRGFSPELERRLRAEARRHHTSLNRAALHLLSKGAGLANDGDSDVIGDSLARYAGSWGAEETQAFDEVVADFETVDEEVWQ